MDKKKRNIFKILILIALLVLFIIIPYNNKNIAPHIFIPQPFAGDTLSRYVMIDKSLGAKGHPLGYIYELANDVEKAQQCKRELTHNSKAIDLEWDRILV